jgi:hypothetical protein
MYSTVYKYPQIVNPLLCKISTVKSFLHYLTNIFVLVFRDLLNIYSILNAGCVCCACQWYCHGEQFLRFCRGNTITNLSLIGNDFRFYTRFEED